MNHGRHSIICAPSRPKGKQRKWVVGSARWSRANRKGSRR